MSGLRVAAASTIVMLAASGAYPVAAQQFAVPTTDAEREHFLRHAEIIASTSVSSGITRSRRTTLRNPAGIAHDAHVQTVDIRSPSFEGLLRLDRSFVDSYKSNIAAYLIDRLLGIGMIPVTVLRELNSVPGSFTWWVDGFQMTGRERVARRRAPPDPAIWDKQMGVMAAFDQLIQNNDRNLDNIVIDNAWKLWMIDHSRAFRLEPHLKRPQDIHRIDRVLFVRIKGLKRHDIEARAGVWLNAAQIDALMARRDLIVESVEKRLKSHGEKEVFYEWLRAE